MHSWTKNEILLLNEYQEALNNYYGIESSVRPDFEHLQVKIFELEAKLLIINKLVKGQLNNKIIGLYSFNEALELHEKELKKGNLFTYLPINILSYQEQQKF